MRSAHVSRVSPGAVSNSSTRETPNASRWLTPPEPPSARLDAPALETIVQPTCASAGRVGPEVTTRYLPPPASNVTVLPMSASPWLTHGAAASWSQSADESRDEQRDAEHHQRDGAREGI